MQRRSNDPRDSDGLKDTILKAIYNSMVWNLKKRFSKPKKLQNEASEALSYRNPSENTSTPSSSSYDLHRAQSSRSDGNIYGHHSPFSFNAQHSLKRYQNLYNNPIGFHAKTIEKKKNDENLQRELQDAAGFGRAIARMLCAPLPVHAIWSESQQPQS